MSISAEIVDSYNNARPVIARKLAQGPREDQALALVMGASGLFLWQVFQEICGPQP